MQEDLILGGLAILFAGLVVLVPILGLTLRFAIKPFFDTWAEIQRGRIAGGSQAQNERQLSLLEAELQQVQQTLQGLLETQEFQRQLAAPAFSDAATPQGEAAEIRVPPPASR